MDSWEVLERAIPRAASGRVAQLLGVGADYVRKWRREPESDESPTASGHRSILDRICNLLDAIFIVNPPGAGLVVNHVIEHHQSLLETHAQPFAGDTDKARSVSHLLTEATEAINRLNLEGPTDETLRELIELRDAAASTIIRVQKTMTETDCRRGPADLPTLGECRQLLDRKHERGHGPA